MMTNTVTPINKKIRIRKGAVMYIFTDIDKVYMVSCTHPGMYMVNEQIDLASSGGTTTYYAVKCNAERIHIVDGMNGTIVPYTHWAVNAHGVEEVK